MAMSNNQRVNLVYESNPSDPRDVVLIGHVEHEITLLLGAKNGGNPTLLAFPAKTSLQIMVSIVTPPKKQTSKVPLK